MIKLLNKKAFFSIVILLSFLLSLVPLNAAFTYNTLTYSGTDYDASSHLNNNIVHSTGKFIYVYSDRVSGLTKLIMNIYNPSGTLISAHAITLSGANGAYKLKVFEINSTYAGIAYTYLATHPYFNVVSVNLASLLDTFATPYELNGTYAVGTLYMNDLTMVKYSGSYYFECTHVQTSNWYNQMHILKFDPSTNAVTKIGYMQEYYTSGTPANSGGMGSMVLDDALGEVYFSTSFCETPTISNYYKCILSSGVMEELAEAPSRTATNNRRMLPMDAGIIDDGDDRYLYFTSASPWILGGDARRYEVTQMRLKFNQTISYANLLDTNIRGANIAPGLPAGSAETWIYGAVDNINPEQNVTVWMPSYVGSTYYILIESLGFPDWFNFGINSVDVNGVEPADDDLAPFEECTDVIGYNATTTWMTIEDETANVIHVYYGLVPGLQFWHFAITWVPYVYNAPLETATRYVFTVEMRCNGVPSTCTIARYMDGIHRETVNASGGIYEFDYTPSVSGMLTMGFKVYNLLGDSVLNESTTFLVVKADVAPTPAEDMVFTLDMFLHWMPVMLLVIVPAVMLGQELGALGYVTGLFFGVVAGLYAGILPTWVLYVTLLLVSIIAVVYMKGRGGG